MPERSQRVAVAAALAAACAIGFLARRYLSLPPLVLRPRSLPRFAKSMEIVTALRERGVEVVEPIAKFLDARRTIVNDSHVSLSLVLDFDHTLSAPVSHSSHGVIEHNPALPSTYSAEVHALFDYYYPLEHDLHVDRDTKIALMDEWWTKAHDLLIHYQITRDILRQSVTTAMDTGKLSLRSDAREMLELCARYDIPVLIFSAGLADVIDEFLQQCNIRTNNVEIVGNRMVFANDNEGRLVGFRGEIVTSLTKNFGYVESHRQQHRAIDGAGSGDNDDDSGRELDEAQHRRNVLLVGDHLNDHRMIDGLNPRGAVLKFAFVNDSKPEKREAYRAYYDALIDREGGFAMMLDIVRECCGEAP